MNTTTQATRKAVIKGDLSATVIYDNILQLWFHSPTGDICDSQILELVCVDNEQANFIAKRHREAWGLE